jgi:hypothetical protein
VLAELSYFFRQLQAEPFHQREPKIELQNERASEAGFRGFNWLPATGQLHEFYG